MVDVVRLSFNENVPCDEDCAIVGKAPGSLGQVPAPLLGFAYPISYGQDA